MPWGPGSSPLAMEHPNNLNAVSIAHELARVYRYADHLTGRMDWTQTDDFQRIAHLDALIAAAKRSRVLVLERIDRVHTDPADLDVPF